jgi:RNA recognition motif-containing protein
MNHGFSGGKRAREAERDRKQREKQERLRRNRELRARGLDPTDGEIAPVAEPLPEVKLEDIVLGVPPRPKRESLGPVKVFVGGLSWDTGSDALRTAVEKFGPVVEATVVSDRDTGRSRGFGFVTFESLRDAETCVKELNGAELDGRKLKVNLAQAR